MTIGNQKAKMSEKKRKNKREQKRCAGEGKLSIGLGDSALYLPDGAGRKAYKEKRATRERGDTGSKLSTASFGPRHGNIGKLFPSKEEKKKTFELGVSKKFRC